ncbi:hypothetical protein [Lentzea kristufekii]|uniref:hypothetical protein n=1 Tax=Lentzea kristufekii TaxID=3095430 RepID=UPI00387324A6
MGDRTGRKKLLLTGAFGFGLASLLAAFAPSAGWLIVGRALVAAFIGQAASSSSRSRRREPGGRPENTHRSVGSAAAPRPHHRAPVRHLRHRLPPQSKPARNRLASNPQSAVEVRFAVHPPSKGTSRDTVSGKRPRNRFSTKMSF